MPSAWSREALKFVRFDLPLEFLQHLTDVGIPILAKEMTEAKLAFYLEDGRWEEAARLDFANQAHLALAKTDYEQRIQSGLSNNFSGSLDTAVANIAQDTESWANSVANNLPYLTAAQENAYMDDLMARDRANQVLADENRYMNNSLHMAYDLRVARGEPPWWFYAGRTGMKFAWKLINPLGALLFEGGDAGLDYYYASKDIETDQRMRDLAAHSLDRAFLAERWMWLNLAGGLATVEQAATSGPPVLQKGTIDSVHLFEERASWNLKKRVYADVIITNPADSGGEAAYVLRALGIQRSPEVRYVVADLMNDQNGDQRVGIVLQPGESTTVRLYFYDKDRGAEEDMDPGSSYALWLLAYNGNGIYSVDAYRGTFNPTVTMAANQAQVVAHGSNLLTTSDAGRLMAQSSNEPAVGFPVVASTLRNTDYGHYTLVPQVENPFPRPIAYVISQAIPAGVTVVDPGDGAVSNGQIVWYRVLQPREVIYLKYGFSYSGGGTGQITLPPVNLSYYDASANATITLNTDPVNLYLRLPLEGKAIYDATVSVQSQQTISVTVTNNDRAGAQEAELILNILIPSGTEVISQTTPVSLAAGDSRTYELTYTISSAGSYILSVSLRYEGEIIPIAYDLLGVQLVVIPKINRLDPLSRAAGSSGFSLWVYGSDFAGGARIFWNGMERPTHGMTSFLYADISADDLANPGSVPVKVVNPDGRESNVVDFEIVTTPPPGAFNLRSPLEGTTVPAPYVELAWEPSAGASSYEYYFYQKSPFDTMPPTIFWVSAGSSTKRGFSNLIPGYHGRWGVRARNSGGLTYASGTERTFNVGPGMFEKTTPTIGAVSADNNVTLTWGVSSGAGRYEYCYDTVNNNTCDSQWVSTSTKSVF